MFDNEKFEYIVEKYKQEIYDYCCHKLKDNIPLADESTRDVFLTLFKKWDNLEVGEYIRAWLYRTADNCILHNASKNKKYYSHIVSLEEGLEKHDIAHLIYYDEYFAFDPAQEDKYIEQIMEVLPEEYKIIFKYRYIEKKTINETSKLVGIPYASLYLRLTKIESIVRDEIKKNF